MSDEPEEWTDYVVRCRRWVRNGAGKKVWETVALGAVNEAQARQFYDDIERGKGALEKPRIFVRTVTERPLDA